MRRLLIIPIIHSQSDLGSLADPANVSKTAALGSERAGVSRRGIGQFWQELTACFETMSLDFERLLIYQDGLPLIENSALQLERQIVEDLARNGSPNHQIVKGLMDRGACLVGTESTALLMKEYAAIRESLAQGFRETQRVSNSNELSDEISSSDHAAMSLLEQRDRFIAERIGNTLGEQQLGILFIGMLHRVENYLPSDVAVEYPVGRPHSHVAIMSER